jgi:glycosyltransferase involved in cell wall biosynthesis
MASIFPISAVVPTRNRSRQLQRTLESLARQSAQPVEIIIVDASKSDKTAMLCQQTISGLQSRMQRVEASICGAATQRNQGVALATQPFILFFDDDIIFEPDCIRRIWQALQEDQQLGGVNAMIVNQNYGNPGAVSRIVFTLLNGRREKSFAGRVIGPAVNLLPEDRPDLPEIVPVDWLNLGCTTYRREALPNPPFRSEFTGYSLMEDLALSLEVGKSWNLANARTARIFHDSQPADYKSDARLRSCMDLVNRHFVMTRIMGRHGFGDYFKLLLWEAFQFAAFISTSRPSAWTAILSGKARGVRVIIAQNRRVG